MLTTRQLIASDLIALAVFSLGTARASAKLTQSANKEAATALRAARRARVARGIGRSAAAELPERPALHSQR